MYTHEVPVRERTEAVCVCERGREAGGGGRGDVQGRAIARVVVRGRGRTERRIFVSPLVCLPPTNYPSRLTRCVVRAMIARLACCTPRLTQMCTLIRCRFVYCSMKLCVSCLYTCERCVYTRAKTCIHTEHDVIHTSKSVRVYTI